MRNWTWLLALLGAFALVAVGCGDDGSGDDDDDMMVDAGPDGGMGDDDDDDDDDDELRCWGDRCTSAGSALTECPGEDTAARRCLAEASVSRITGTGDIGDPDEEPVRLSSAIEGPDLEVEELPGGEIVEVFDWRGGYCITEGDPEGAGCGSNADCRRSDDCTGRCLTINGQTGTTGCVRACNPGRAGNGDCRDNYRCAEEIAGGTCWPGCTDDLECRVAREDTNGNGVIDPYDPSTNTVGDRLVYDEESEAFCDDNSRDGSYACINPGTPGVSPGEPCERSSECMENGQCIIEELPENSIASPWTDGYCVKPRCLSDGDCGEGGICQAKGFGGAACLASCDFAAEVNEDGSLGDGALGEDGGSPDCRPGYQCEWVGLADAAGQARTDGACIPGNYNAVESPNLGEACVRNSDCYSPLGNGRCQRYTLGGNLIGSYCTVTDCQPSQDFLDFFFTNPESATVFPPGVPDNESYCGENALCMLISGDAVNGTAPVTTECVKRCETADDCAPGLACNDTVIGPGPNFLFDQPTCSISCRRFEDVNGDGNVAPDEVTEDSSMCRADEVCSDDGLCVPGDS